MIKDGTCLKQNERRATSDERRFSNSWGILLGIPAIFVLAYFYERLGSLQDVEICAIKRFLNIPCPGCGLTRSFALLTHGNFGASVFVHPFGFIIALWFVYLFFSLSYSLIFSRTLPRIFSDRQRDWLLGIFVVGMFVRWFVILTKGVL